MGLSTPHERYALRGDEAQSKVPGIKPFIEDLKAQLPEEAAGQ